MTNVPKEWPMEEYKDISCVNHWKLLKSQTDDAKILATAREEYQRKSRDNARTPMQWTSDTDSGGFSNSATPPWMTINPNTRDINAEAQISDPSSPFNFWRSVLAVRKKYKDILIYGDFEMLDEADQNILAYRRRGEDGGTILVVCNFSAKEIEWPAKFQVEDVKEIILSNCGRSFEGFDGSKIVLAPYETFVLILG